MSVESARQAYARGAWREACTLFASEVDLDPHDLELLAIAAYLVGENDQSAASWERAYTSFLGRGEHSRAARCAFWLAMTLILNGEPAHGGGWLARA